MVTVRTLGFMLLVASACAEKPCVQNRITRGGALQPETGVPIVAESFPYGVVGEPVAGRIFAPLTACEGDAVRVTGRFDDGEGSELPFEMSELQIDPKSRVVFTDITIPPQQSGVAGAPRAI